MVLGASSSTVVARTSPATDVEEVAGLDSPWVTIVWDDPVNLMTYVTYVFQKLFGYSEVRATVQVCWAAIGTASVRLTLRRIGAKKKSPARPIL